MSGELRVAAATSPPRDESTDAVLAVMGTAATHVRACLERALEDGREDRHFPEYQARRLSRWLRLCAAQMKPGEVETVDGRPLTAEQRVEHRALIEQYEQALASPTRPKRRI